MMGHIRGKKLAQNNSKPLKASIRLALMHCFVTTSISLHRTSVLNGTLYSTNLSGQTKPPASRENTKINRTKRNLYDTVFFQ